VKGSRARGFGCDGSPRMLHLSSIGASHTRARDACMSEPVSSTSSAALPGPVGRAFVRVWIALAVIFFLGALLMIAYRWMVTEEPSSVLIIDASPALKGAEAQVKRADQLEPYKSTFGDELGFSLPFYLDPGTYEVRIMMNGEKIAQADVVVPSHYMQRLDLTKLEPPSSPTTAASVAGSPGVAH
jgi:hypothetical protein